MPFPLIPAAAAAVKAIFGGGAATTAATHGTAHMAAHGTAHAAAHTTAAAAATGAGTGAASAAGGVGTFAAVKSATFGAVTLVAGVATVPEAMLNLEKLLAEENIAMPQDTVSRNALEQEIAIAIKEAKPMYSYSCFDGEKQKAIPSSFKRCPYGDYPIEKSEQPTIVFEKPTTGTEDKAELDSEFFLQLQSSR